MTCSSPCPAPPPPKGQFSAPDRRGFRWFTPEYRQYPSNLWHLAQVVRTRMLADRGMDPRGVPGEAQIRHGIESHPCNAHLKGKMFLPRFSSDRCTGTGSHYGSIYIPFEFDGAAPPKPGPPPPGPAPSPPAPGPKPSPQGCAVVLDSLAPPEIRGCSGITSSDVTPQLIEELWLEARCRVALTLRRLNHLASLPEADRKARWNVAGSPERTWFGGYQRRNFAVIRKCFQRIAGVLGSPRLKIVCDPRRTRRCQQQGKGCTWASAHPGIHKITLKEAFLFGTPSRDERIQTLIHEAAHVARVSSPSEYRKYGPACAKKLARQNCFKSKRNADNYGYYAMRHVGAYQAASASTCSKNYFPKRSCA